MCSPAGSSSLGLGRSWPNSLKLIRTQAMSSTEISSHTALRANSSLLRTSGPHGRSGTNCCCDLSRFAHRRAAMLLLQRYSVTFRAGRPCQMQGSSHT